jgi:hypothetical protein
MGSHRATRDSTDAVTTPPARSSTRLREQIDLDALAAKLLAVVEQSVQPVRLSLWLRPPRQPTPLHEAAPVAASTTR